MYLLYSDTCSIYRSKDGKAEWLNWYEREASGDPVDGGWRAMEMTGEITGLSATCKDAMEVIEHVITLAGHQPVLLCFCWGL
jgi:hypothetical protein